VLCLLLAAGWRGAPTWAAEPGPRTPHGFTDLWLSRDQQGRWHFEHRHFGAAADAFADPLWRGIALYRAGDFAAAADAFATAPTPEGRYNLGNALAHLQRYAEAVAAYDQALAARPAWAEALGNRALVAALIPDDEDADEALDDEGDADAPDPAGEKRKGRKPVRRRVLGEAEITRLWLDRIQLSPAGFLKRRFAQEIRQVERDAKAEPP
jgi:Ca-activated chloride channel family protein